MGSNPTADTCIFVPFTPRVRCVGGCVQHARHTRDVRVVGTPPPCLVVGVGLHRRLFRCVCHWVSSCVVPHMCTEILNIVCCCLHVRLHVCTPNCTAYNASHVTTAPKHRWRTNTHTEKACTGTANTHHEPWHCVMLFYTCVWYFAMPGTAQVRRLTAHRHVVACVVLMINLRPCVYRHVSPRLVQHMCGERLNIIGCLFALCCCMCFPNNGTVLGTSHTRNTTEM